MYHYCDDDTCHNWIRNNHSFQWLQKYISHSKAIYDWVLYMQWLYIINWYIYNIVVKITFFNIYFILHFYNITFIIFKIIQIFNTHVIINMNITWCAGIIHTSLLDHEGLLILSEKGICSKNINFDHLKKLKTPPATKTYWTVLVL